MNVFPKDPKLSIFHLIIRFNKVDTLSYYLYCDFFPLWIKNINRDDLPQKQAQIKLEKTITCMIYIIIILQIITPMDKKSLSGNAEWKIFAENLKKKCQN